MRTRDLDVDEEEKGSGPVSEVDQESYVELEDNEEPGPLFQGQRGA